MKRLLLISVLILGMCAYATHANAQGKVKAVKKAVELVTKKGAVKKTAKPVRAVKPAKTYKTVQVTCGTCSGRRTVAQWNSYYQGYQTVTCSRCNGTGKVKKVIATN